MQPSFLLTTISVCTLLSAAVAQSVVVPNANAAARGTAGLNTVTRDLGNPRTYMLGLPASELAAIPTNSVITGVSFRAMVITNNPASWPAADLPWNDYQIQIGAANPTSAWTTTFLSNFSGTPVTIRTGPMVVPAGTHANSAALPAPDANPWGEFFFDFQDVFPYAGGDLGLYLTHPGSTVAGTFLFIDGRASSPTTGVAYSASSLQATTGAAATYSIPRLHYGYGTTCPGTNNAKPVLNLTNNTTGGGNIHLGVGNARPSAPMVYGFGAGRITAPLPGGCVLLTVPLVTLPATTDGNGRHLLPLNVPVSAFGTVEIQSFVVDPAAASGFTATNGVSLTAN